MIDILRKANEYSHNKQKGRLNNAMDLLDDILNEFGHKEQIVLSAERIREIRGLLSDVKEN